MADASRNFEEQMLRMKFRSLAFTGPKRQQKLKEVTEEKKESFRDKSYTLWKRLNPGYFEDDDADLTTARDAQHYQANDFHVADKSHYRVKDKHTEYVEYVVRDKALARKGGSSPTASPSK